MDIIKKVNLPYFIMFLFGFLSTMPILNFFSLTTYTILLFISIGVILVYSFTNKLYISFRYIDFLFIIIMILWIISTVISYVKMSGIWSDGSINSIIMFFMILILYIFFSITSHNTWIIAYVKGVYGASVFQMVWGYLQLLLYFFGKIDLNNLIFREWLKMVDFSATQITEDSIKVSGLCWNAGNMAPLLTFGYVYTNSIILKFCFVILSLISGSRTSFLGIIFCILIEIFGKKERIKKINHNVTGVIIIIVTILCIIILFNRNTTLAIISKIKNIIISLANINNESSGSIHLRYVTSVFNITKKNNILNNLLGYGDGCSGYPFSLFYRQYVSSKWVVECDPINFLWNYGYICFILYYFWYAIKIIKGTKLDFKYAVLFVTFLFEGVFYNITFNWTRLLIIFIFILINKNVNIFLFKSKEKGNK